MNATAYVFMIYPVSQGFRAKVDQIAGKEANHLLIAELRNMGPREMLLFLRRMDRRTKIYIPLEDSYSGALLPVLLGLAAVSSAKQTTVIQPDGSTYAMNRLQSLSCLFSVAASSLIGFLSLLRCWQYVRQIERQQRFDCALEMHNRNILYVNANLWFGVRAGGSVGHIAGVLNELASKVGMDALEFRRRNLRDARLRAVLDAAAERFGWAGAKPGPDRGVGLACGTEKGGFVATCA